MQEMKNLGANCSLPHAKEPGQKSLLGPVHFHSQGQRHKINFAFLWLVICYIPWDDGLYSPFPSLTLWIGTMVKRGRASGHLFMRSMPTGHMIEEGTGWHWPMPALEGLRSQTVILGSILLHTHYTHTHTHTCESAVWNSERVKHGKLVLSKALQLPAGFSPPFLWCSSILSGAGMDPGKGIKFWVESLITDSAELSFRAQFSLPSHLYPCLLCFLHLGTPLAPPTLTKSMISKMAKRKPCVTATDSKSDLLGSWAPETLSVTPFLPELQGDRLHSASITFPEFNGQVQQLLLRKRREVKQREEQDINT